MTIFMENTILIFCCYFTANVTVETHITIQIVYIYQIILGFIPLQILPHHFPFRIRFLDADRTYLIKTVYNCYG